MDYLGHQMYQLAADKESHEKKSHIDLQKSCEQLEKRIEKLEDLVSHLVIHLEEKDKTKFDW